MAIFTLSFPVIVVRSIVVAAINEDRAVRALIDCGAEHTGSGMHRDKTLGFYVEPNNPKLQVGVQQLDQTSEVDETPPEGTVMQ